MSLSRKLLLSFGVMLGLVLLLGASALLVTRDLNQELERAANVTARQQYLAGEVNASTSELTSLERGAVLAAMLGDSAHAGEYHQKFNARAEALRNALSNLKKLAETRAASDRVQALDQQAVLVQQAHLELSQAVANQHMDAGLVIFAQKVVPRLEEIGNQATALVEQQTR